MGYSNASDHICGLMQERANMKRFMFGRSEITSNFGCDRRRLWITQLSERTRAAVCPSNGWSHWGATTCPREIAVMDMYRRHKQTMRKLELLMPATHEHMQRQDDAVQTYDGHTPINRSSSSISKLDGSSQEQMTSWTRKRSRGTIQHDQGAIPKHERSVTNEKSNVIRKNRTSSVSCDEQPNHR